MASILQNLSPQVFFFLLCLLGSIATQAQENPLETIVQSDDPKIKRVVDQLEQHQVQLLYFAIDRDQENKPQLSEYRFQQDDSLYFYPASTVKLPIAVLALEKLNQLKKAGVPITQDTPFHIVNPKTGEYIIQQDSTHPRRELTIGHLIKKIFLVSDNDAYNYLFDFVGSASINQMLQDKGIEHTAIRHKFLFGADNENSWEYVFLQKQDTLYHQKSSYSHPQPTVKLKAQSKGKAYMKSGEKVAQPMDFSQKNWMALSAQLAVLKRLIFPEIFSKEARFDLTSQQLDFLRFWMSRNTLESQIEAYNNSDEYYDSYGKFFLYGDTKGEMHDGLRIYNKVGYAYGTLTDVAYIKAEEEGVEFFLAATILVNENETFNDNLYEFESIGIPFLAEIGRQLYAYELQRK